MKSKKLKVKGRPSVGKPSNLVAKNARNFNKAQVHIDRKKAVKRGYVRCKNNILTIRGDYKAA